MQEPIENQQEATAESPTFTFAEEPGMGGSTSHDGSDRRQSDEWDASKVPPSRFQKRKGSIYATPNSRDGHIQRNYAEKYHARIAEMSSRRKSKDGLDRS